jgi:hypothetical protein
MCTLPHQPIIFLYTCSNVFFNFVYCFFFSPVSSPTVPLRHGASKPTAPPHHSPRAARKAARTTPATSHATSSEHDQHHRHDQHEQHGHDDKALSAEEKLFFSKRPRAVEFQPYSGVLPSVGTLGTLGPDLERPELVSKVVQNWLPWGGSLWVFFSLLFTILYIGPSVCLCPRFEYLIFVFADLSFPSFLLFAPTACATRENQGICQGGSGGTDDGQAARTQGP